MGITELLPLMPVESHGEAEAELLLPCQGFGFP